MGVGLACSWEAICNKLTPISGEVEMGVELACSREAICNKLTPISREVEMGVGLACSRGQSVDSHLWRSGDGSGISVQLGGILYQTDFHVQRGGDGSGISVNGVHRCEIVVCKSTNMKCDTKLYCDKDIMV